MGRLSGGTERERDGGGVAGVRWSGRVLRRLQSQCWRLKKPCMPSMQDMQPNPCLDSDDERIER